jgi:hypothetical protein
MKRIYHTWDKWECYPAGFYENHPVDRSLTAEECRQAYASFLSDLSQFETALQRVLKEWPRSCEHYLTNENMNRIAWLGQASACIALGIPAIFCGGFYLMSEEQQAAANELALKYLNIWMVSQGYAELTMDQAQPRTKANLY